ncbi:hypothetical protein H4R35_004820 [Dimargaris xerosporica]|nr:hypothetical protein H4R35_004820 [Dimargaris xerosporica]
MMRYATRIASPMVQLARQHRGQQLGVRSVVLRPCTNLVGGVRSAASNEPTHVSDTPFAPGDYVVVRDCSLNRSALRGPLTPGDKLPTSSGLIAHDEILGQLNRAYVLDHKRRRHIVTYPTLDEYIQLTRRHCTPIYPKDAAAIVSLLDLSPGAVVLEAGTGAGSLSMHLAQSIGGYGLDGFHPAGRVDTVEVRRDHFQKAQELISNFQRGKLLPWIRFHRGSLGALIAELAEQEAESPLVEQLGPCNGSKTLPVIPRTAARLNCQAYDGAVLDLPNPWRELAAVTSVLKTNRFVVCYLPNMSQVLHLIRAIRHQPSLRSLLVVEDVVEVLWRAWEIKATTIRQPSPSSTSDSASLPSPDTDKERERDQGAVSATAEPADPASTEAWVCHPERRPVGHTAFLVRLRKVQPAPARERPLPENRP